MMLAGLKRTREWVEDEDDGQGQAECKIARVLPFRSSPNSQYSTISFSSRPRITRPPLLTPVESSEDESDCERSPQGIKKPSLTLDLLNEDMDVDMEELQDQPVWSPRAPDSTLASTFPPSTRLTIDTPRFANTQTPRVPTPIYGHFSAPKYPSDMPPPSPAMPPPSYVNTLTYPRVRDSDPFLRRRALPSPISEDENMASPLVMTKELLSNFKVSASPEPSFSSQETLTPDTPSTKNWSSLADISPKNRRRSDAISGETNKVIFSMGFRADCDKCRERVPGHYSHVIRT